MRSSRLKPCKLLVFLLLLAIAGCGKKGALIPPEALVPAPIGNLALAQQGNHFQLSWTAPTKEKGGARLKDLAGFILFRRVPLPANLDCDECPGAYAERARIDLDYLKETRRIGDLFLFDDSDLKLGQSYRYKVISFTSSGAQSRDSNKVQHTALHAPLPPVLEAHSSATSVLLDFVAIPPGEGKILGYDIYRSKSGQPAPLAPLNTKPVAANSYEDKALLAGVPYDYTVRVVVVMPNGETAVSPPSNQAQGSLLERD